MHLDLSLGELKHWHQHGFVCRAGVFARAELAALQAAAVQAAGTARAAITTGHSYSLDGNHFVDLPDQTTVQFEHQADTDVLRVVEPVHHLAPGMATLVDHPQLTRPMAQLVGSKNLALWTAKLNLKQPRDGSGFRWHQDSPYWMHDCNHLDQLVNVMVLLDDASISNGCFRIIRGSHRQGMLPGTDDGSQLGGFFTAPDSFDEAQAVDLQLPAGSLVFFSAHVVHGSGPNRSNEPRRAVILTYQPAGWPLLKTGVVRPVLRPEQVQQREQAGLADQPAG